MMRRAISAVILMFLALACSGTAQFVPTSVGVFTATPSSFASPTWTLLPTLPPDEAMKRVADLLQDNAGCRLPCWWGIIPGETPWQEARHFLEQFASKVEVSDPDRPLFSMFVIVPTSEDISSARLRYTYVIQDGVIERIYIPTTGHVEAYKLSNFLNTYGPPDEIRVRTYSTPYQEGFLPFEFELFYPERGILAIYYDLSTWWEEGQMIGYPQEDDSPFLGLWSPKQRLSFDEASKMFGEYDEQWRLMPLEEVTDMDVETFYETYRQPEAEVCVRTPQELWPPQ